MAAEAREREYVKDGVRYVEIATYWNGELVSLWVSRRP